MPAGSLDGQDAKDVAAYVAYAAGEPGRTSGALAQAGLAGAKTGEQIFTAAGCAGCHTLSKAGANGNIGPSLNELPPRPEHEPGVSAEEYVRKSILEPGRFIVDGFQEDVMPPSRAS